MIYSGRWSAIRRGRGDLPPIVDGLQFFGDLTSSRTSIVSGAVATLGDASGHDRDATQGTAGNRPTYNASDASFGGRPSMSGDGISREISTAAFSPSATDDATYYVVSKGGSILGRLWRQGRPFVSGGSTTSRTTYFSAVGTSSKDTTIVAATPFVLATVFATTTPASAIPKIYLNGADTGAGYATTAATSSGLGPAALTIFGNQGSTWSDDTVTDVLVYSGAHTATQAATISAWLAWRNGL